MKNSTSFAAFGRSQRTSGYNSMKRPTRSTSEPNIKHFTPARARRQQLYADMPFFATHGLQARTSYIARNISQTDLRTLMTQAERSGKELKDDDSQVTIVRSCEAFGSRERVSRLAAQHSVASANTRLHARARVARFPGGPPSLTRGRRRRRRHGGVPGAAQLSKEDIEAQLTEDVVTMPLLMAVLVAVIAQFLNGYNTSVMNAPESVVFPGHSTLEWSLAVSSFAIGAPLGCVFGGIFANVQGRRRALIVDTWIFLIGGAMMACAPTILWLVAARLVIGFASGLGTVIVPIYLGEARCVSCVWPRVSVGTPSPPRRVMDVLYIYLSARVRVRWECARRSLFARARARYVPSPSPSPSAAARRAERRHTTPTVRTTPPSYSTTTPRFGISHGRRRRARGAHDERVTSDPIEPRHDDAVSRR